MSPVRNWHRQLVLSRDHFSNYLKQHDEKTLSANCFIEVHKVNMIDNGHSLYICRGGYFVAPIDRSSLNLFNLAYRENATTE